MDEDFEPRAFRVLHDVCEVYEKHGIDPSSIKYELDQLRKERDDLRSQLIGMEQAADSAGKCCEEQYKRIKELKEILTRIKDRFESQDKGGFPRGSMAWAMYQDAKEGLRSVPLEKE
jgi:hypothetical protein